MAWEDLSITKPHLVYILLGAFTSLFMLCSSFIKERLYIGEATIATIFGVIFGPHCANLINPLDWGSVDIVTIEFSRIVLVVQCFAVGVELPKYYMEKHWRSVVILLLPIMTWGWLITSLFVWWLIKPLSWLESLVVAACVTATDPVLASSVVGKGKFAQRVPKHLRDLLSAESGCNDGMAFPFLYLGVWLILEHKKAGPVSFHWFIVTILYGCIFGAFYGFIVGYIGRHGIRFAERYDLIDRESFLVFYFVLALFCAGSGSMLGLDDLLVGFTAGVGFSNDGWFHQKTEESHVSNVIDLLLNLTYFVYLGTIIPWEMYNDTSIGLSAWRLVIIAILVILFRRIPIMLLMKPFIPDIKTWREALFAGHFGPIGVGAIFVAMLARAEMEVGETVPESELPEPTSPHYNLILLVWPIVTFLVISSIIVHGSSIAVFTLGKRINTLSLTMSYTQAVDDGNSGWASRLPRILSTSKSQARTVDSESEDAADILRIMTNPPPGGFLRRRRSEDGNRSRASSLKPRRRKKKSMGGPIEQSAIYPARYENDVTTQPATQQPTSNEEENSSTAASNNNNINSNNNNNQSLSEPAPTDGRPDDEITSDSRPQNQEPDTETDVEPPRRQSSARSQTSHTSRNSRDSKANSHSNINLYDEGDHLVFENDDGDVLGVVATHDSTSSSKHGFSNEPDPEKGGLPPPVTASTATNNPSHLEVLGWSFKDIRKRISNIIQSESQKRKEVDQSLKALRSANARVFQFGNTVLIEDEYGNVLKLYEFESVKAAGSANTTTILKLMGMGNNDSNKNPTANNAGEGSSSAPPPGTAPVKRRTFLQRPAEPEIDDRHIRFTLGGEGKRLTKEDFINEMRKLDMRTRQTVLKSSSASAGIKALATMERQTNNAAIQDNITKKKHTRIHGQGHDAPNDGNGEKSSRKAPAAKPSNRVETVQHRNSDAVTSSGSESDNEDVETRGRSTRAKEPSHEEISKNVHGLLAPAAIAPPADQNDEDEVETAAERRRRLAVLGTIHDDDTSKNATPVGIASRSGAATPAAPVTPAAASGTRGDYFSGPVNTTPGGGDGSETPARSRGIRFAPENKRR